MVAQGLTPPRVGTPRSKARTLGPIAADVASTLGVEWWPWQRHVIDTSLELYRQRGRKLLRLRAGSVGVLVPRQCGKSIVARVRGWMQCLLPELDGVEDLVGAPVGAQHVGWLCQDRANALRAWGDGVDMLMDSPYREAVKRVKLQRGDESVQFKNGSWLRVVTPSRTGPRGLDLDLILLDEALAHEVSLLAALAPTQAARDQAPASLGAQLVALSSGGDDRSTLLQTMTEVGRRAVAERDRTRAWFEWSADPTCDVYDPAAWASAIPTLDRPGGISTAFVAMQAETMDREDFATEYLCLYTPRPAAQVIDLDHWHAAPEGVPVGTVVFGIDITPAGNAATLVACGFVREGIAVEIIEQRGGIDWVASLVIEKAKRWDAAVAVDTSGPAAWLVPTLEKADVDVVKVRASDALAAASRLAAAVDEGRIVHEADTRFDAAIAAAVRRRSGDRWGFDRHNGDVTALVATALGVWAIETTSVLQPQVW